MDCGQCVSSLKRLVNRLGLHLTANKHLQRPVRIHGLHLITCILYPLFALALVALVKLILHLFTAAVVAV
jgi:hypothetical protein